VVQKWRPFAPLPWCKGKAFLEPVQILPELSLEELLAKVTEPPEPEVDWGRPMGNEMRQDR
jgi:hypothetical protein